MFCRPSAGEECEAHHARVRYWKHKQADRQPRQFGLSSRSPQGKGFGMSALVASPFGQI